MRASFSQSGQRLHVELHLETPADGKRADKARPSERYALVRPFFDTELPEGWKLEAVHPDHLALVALLVAHPFTVTRLELPFGVTAAFAEAQSASGRYVIGPVDPHLTPWTASKEGRPGLAFSGGADSTAALSLMPSNTVPVFLDRPIVGRSLYRKDAALHSCARLRRMGYDVRTVSCDLEYMREPVGFPIDLANAIPAILLASHLDLDSIAFGMIMETAYRTGHVAFRDYATSSHFRLWGGLFSAAGIPLNLVTAGVSEIGTLMIALNTEVGGLAQSCIRGSRRRPCRNCWKCFRKVLLQHVLQGDKLTSHLLKEMFAIREAKKYLADFPIKHENVLTYITSRYEGGDEVMQLLRRRVRGDRLPTTWMEGWYEPSVDLLPSQYRSQTITALNRVLRPLTSDEANFARSWDMQPMLADAYYQRLHVSLKRALEGA